MNRKSLCIGAALGLFLGLLLPGGCTWEFVREDPPLMTGTYTLMPRPQARQNNATVEVYLAKVVVTTETTTFSLRNSATGDKFTAKDFRCTGAMIQDLDSSDFYEAVSIGVNGDTVTFDRLKTKQFRLFDSSSPHKVVFDNITLMYPD